MAESYWPLANRIAASLPGADIENTPGLAVEVKARSDFNPKAWLKQAASRPGLPIVVMRPNGSGEATVLDWPAFLRWGDLLELLHEAGYGDRQHNAEESGEPR